MSSVLNEAPGDRYQIRKYDGVGFPYGIWDTQTKRFVARGQKVDPTKGIKGPLEIELDKRNQKDREDKEKENKNMSLYSNITKNLKESSCKASKRKSLKEAAKTDPAKALLDLFNEVYDGMGDMYAADEWAEVLGEDYGIDYEDQDADKVILKALRKMDSDAFKGEVDNFIYGLFENDGISYLKDTLHIYPRNHKYIISCLQTLKPYASEPEKVDQAVSELQDVNLDLRTTAQEFQRYLHDNYKPWTVLGTTTGPRTYTDLFSVPTDYDIIGADYFNYAGRPSDMLDHIGYGWKQTDNGIEADLIGYRANYKGSSAVYDTPPTEYGYSAVITPENKEEKYKEMAEALIKKAGEIKKQYKLKESQAIKESENDPTLQEIYDNLQAGVSYGEDMDKEHHSWITYPYFNAVLYLIDDNGRGEPCIGWRHYGSAANPNTIKDLSWILSTIFKMTPEEFVQKYIKNTESKLEESCNKKELKETDENVEVNKQKFIDYCKGKIKPLGSVKVHTKDLMEDFDEEEDKDKIITATIDLEYNDGSKELGGSKLWDILYEDGARLKPNGTIKIVSEWEGAGALNGVAEMDFKYISRKTYNDIIEHWEDWDMSERFEDSDTFEESESLKETEDYEVYEIADGLISELSKKGEHELSSAIYKTLNGIDRANRRGAGYGQRLNKKLRDLVKQAQEKLNESTLKEAEEIEIRTYDTEEDYDNGNYSVAETLTEEPDEEYFEGIVDKFDNPYYTEAIGKTSGKEYGYTYGLDRDGEFYESEQDDWEKAGAVADKIHQEFRNSKNKDQKVLESICKRHNMDLDTYLYVDGYGNFDELIEDLKAGE